MSLSSLLQSSARRAAAPAIGKTRKWPTGRLFYTDSFFEKREKTRNPSSFSLLPLALSLSYPQLLTPKFTQSFTGRNALRISHSLHHAFPIVQPLRHAGCPFPRMSSCLQV